MLSLSPIGRTVCICLVWCLWLNCANPSLCQAQNRKDRSKGNTGNSYDQWSEDPVRSRNGFPINVVEGKLKSIDGSAVVITEQGQDKTYKLNQKTRLYKLALGDISLVRVGSRLGVEGRLHNAGDTGLMVTGHKITYLPPKLGAGFEPYTEREKNSTIHYFEGVVEKLDPLTMRVDKRNTTNYEQVDDNGRTIRNVIIGGKLVEVWKRERRTDEIEVPLAKDASFQDVKTNALIELEVRNNGTNVTKVVLIRSDPVKADELPKPPREKRPPRQSRKERDKKGK